MGGGSPVVLQAAVRAKRVPGGDNTVLICIPDVTRVGKFNHSWHIGDTEFALDLAMTLDGGIDREAVPMRRADNGRLILVPGERPVRRVGMT